MLKIFHMDAGRKFYSVSTIKGILDTMKRTGFDHLQLYMSDSQGFRFALPDMTVRTQYGTYDLSRALGDGYRHHDSRPSGCGQYLKAADFEEILRYARSLGIDVIPGINMPGHLGTILMQYPQFRYPGSNSSLNLGDPEAVAFALEILRMHASYFSGLGCKYYLLGADEYANDLTETDPIVMGFDRIYKDGTMKQFVDFINQAVEIVCSFGMQPLAFNDGVCYHNDDQTYGAVDKRLLVCYWTQGWLNYTPASVKFLEDHGYSLVNVNSKYYVWVGCEVLDEKIRIAPEFDPHVFIDNSHVDHPVGCMMCLWSDYGDFDGQDDGVTVAKQIIPAMEGFGKAMLARE